MLSRLRGIRWVSQSPLSMSQLTPVFQLGTCPMKPRDQGGVVDSKLNVYGVEGLKICDMSIAPSNVSAARRVPLLKNHRLTSYSQNTCSTAFTIAEKAAMIIAEELGIVGSV